MLKPLSGHTWLSTDLPIARLKVRLEKIAAEHHLPVEQYVEEGLGSALMCFGMLDSGVVILLEEFEAAIRHGGSQGPEIHADATDVLRCGVGPLIAEALAALRLTAADVGWKGREPTEAEVAQWVRHAEDARSRKSEQRSRQVQ